MPANLAPHPANSLWRRLDEFPPTGKVGTEAYKSIYFTQANTPALAAPNNLFGRACGAER